MRCGSKIRVSPISRTGNEPSTVLHPCSHRNICVSRHDVSLCRPEQMKVRSLSHSYISLHINNHHPHRVVISLHLFYSHSHPFGSYCSLSLFPLSINPYILSFPPRLLKRCSRSVCHLITTSGSHFAHTHTHTYTKKTLPPFPHSSAF